MREAQWKEMKPLQEQMFTKRDELRKLWLEPNPDQAKILAAQKEMRMLRDQMQDKMTVFIWKPRRFSRRNRGRRLNFSLSAEVPCKGAIPRQDLV